MSKAKRFLESETRFSGAYSATVLNTLMLAYRPYRGRMIICFILGLTGRLILLANANVIGQWVDAISQNQTPDPRSYLSMLVAMTALGFFLTTLFRIGFSRLSARAISQIYDEVTLRTSRYPMSFFDSTPTGRIITRFSSDYGNVFRLFGGPLAEFLAIIFDLICMIILITLANTLYLLIILAVGLANYFVYRHNRDLLRQTRRQLSASRSPSISHFAETAQGAATIRSFNKENTFSGQFERLDSEYLKNRLGTTRELMKYSFKMNFLTALLFLITGTLAYFWLAAGRVSIGSVGVALGFIALSGTTVQMFFEWMAQFEEALVGMERLDQYLRKPLEPLAKLPAASQFATAHPRQTNESENILSKTNLTAQTSAPVRFKNVWFRYQDHLPFVLKGIDLQIEAGERIGIIGRTGSGKSSLIQALFYLYPLSEGDISVAGLSPMILSAGIDIGTYRKSLAYISQDSILFKGPLRNNLDLEQKFTDEELFLALKKVGLPEFASPAGLTLAIEEKGRNLSLGEKQLLCMARCLLQSAPVIIMDEATSSVDPESEEILVKATEEFFAEKTQIIIAHRLSTLKNCNRLLWLDQGKIKMLGPPEEVLPSFQDK